MIVGNQLTPFMSRYSKIVVRQSIVSHDNFIVYLFYFENRIISTGQLKA